jgi:hypothetical protein
VIVADVTTTADGWPPSPGLAGQFGGHEAVEGKSCPHLPRDACHSQILPAAFPAGRYGRVVKLFKISRPRVVIAFSSIALLLSLASLFADGWRGRLSGPIVDWAQLGGAIGAVAAIGYAAHSVQIAKRQGTESNERLIRERRIDFELDVLKELALVNLKDHNVANATAEFTLLTSLLGPEVVPLASAAVGLPSTPQVLADTKNVEINYLSHLRIELQTRITTEIYAAIQERVSARN